MNTDGAAECISALADAFDQDPQAAHDDVTMLADYLDVELVGAGLGEKPATA
jgi:hypothetical protein